MTASQSSFMRETYAGRRVGSPVGISANPNSADDGDGQECDSLLLAYRVSQPGENREAMVIALVCVPTGKCT